MDQEGTVESVELLTTRKRGAARLGISEQTLARIWRQHNLPLVRLGRAVRVPVAVVERLACEGVPGSEQVGNSNSKITRQR